MAEPPKPPTKEREIPCPPATRKALRAVSDHQIADLAASFGLKGKENIKHFTHWFRRASEDTPLWVWSTMSPDFAARRHPVLQPMIRILQKQGDDAKRINQHFGGRWDKITGFDRTTGTVNGMTAAEQAEYNRLILATEMKDWLSDQELRDQKVSKKVTEVYRAHRRLMPWAWRLVNIVREKTGREPLKGIKGVMFPHEFQGNFHIEIDGKPWFGPRGSSWDTQADAYQALREHFAIHPDDVGKAEIVADYQKHLSFAVTGDPEKFAGLNDALVTVARGSSVSPEKVAQWYRDGLEKHGFGTHMLPRAGAPGYDTVNMIRVMSEYLNTLPWWATSELAREQLRTFAGQLDVTKEPHSVYAFTRFVGQVYGHPGGLEMQLDQIVNSLAQGRVGRVWANAVTPWESTPLVGRVAKAVNTDRLNPVAPVRRATMRARALTADLKLGFMSWGVATAHALHSPINVLPAYGFKYWGQGFRDALLANWTPELKGAYDWAQNQGVFKGNLMDDAPGGPFTRMVHRVADKVGANDQVRDLMMAFFRPLSLSERVLRQSAFFGAYRALKDQGVAGKRLLRLATEDAMREFPQLDKSAEKFALEMAKRTVDQVAFRYDRASRPWWTTASAGGPIGLLAGQFKTYITGTIALEKRMWDMGSFRDVEGIKQRGRSIAPIAMMTLLGGVAGGIPFAHLIDDAIRYWTSGGDPEGVGGWSPLDATYMFFRHDIGGKKAEALYRGLPALEGMDMARRVGFSHLHVETPKDLAGAFINTLWDMAMGVYYHDLEHATRIVPGISNIYQAMEWYQTHEVLDPYHRSRLRFTPTRWDIFLRAFGVEPVRQAKLTDVLRITGRKIKTYERTRAEYIDQMARAMEANDDEKYLQLEQEAEQQEIHISLADVHKEMTEKEKAAVVRRRQTVPKALRPWYDKEFGPELEAEKDREEKARAQRALENAQQGVAIPGPIGGE